MNRSREFRNELGALLQRAAEAVDASEDVASETEAEAETDAPDEVTLCLLDCVEYVRESTRYTGRLEDRNAQWALHDAEIGGLEALGAALHRRVDTLVWGMGNAVERTANGIHGRVSLDLVVSALVRLVDRGPRMAGDEAVVGMIGTDRRVAEIVGILTELQQGERRRRVAA
jgi:hypothetical protein